MSSNDTNFELSQVREALANLPELLANATQSSAGSFQVYMAAGWSPVLNLSDDGSYYFLQIIDWTGGTGTKPIVGQYLSSSGWTNNIALASPVGQIGGGSGLPDGNKVEITVAGATWTINNGVVTTAKMGGDVTTAGKALLDDADAAAQRTTLGLGTVATQNANAVNLTGGTLQGVGVVTGSYTSNVNEALLRSCRKASAGTITKGQVVYITGSTGSHLEVELADADTEPTSSKTFGVAAETITSSTEGYVIVEGLLTGLSNLPTASFTNGASLWLSSTAGGWQTTPAVAPANGVYIGRVINASNGNNGSAFIKIQNGYELDELHNVLITDPKDSTQALYYDSVSGLWKNRAAVDADLAAITVFPRFDVDQSATTTQKRTARQNIGFSDSFTTADLLALSSTEAAKLRIAYCSDCYSSAGQAWDSMGDMVYWNGALWLTQSDKVPLCTAWEDWVYAMARNSSGHAVRPSASWWGWTGSTGHLDTQYTSGLGASANGTGTDTTTAATSWVTAGTTTTGVARGIIGPLSGHTKASPYRRVGFAVSHLRHDVGISAADGYHWRYSFEPTAFTATMARQLDHIGFVGDTFNLFGEGATGNNIYAYCRINGTTLLWANTGISESQPAWLVATWEPTSALSGAGVFKICSWINGVKTNHHGANAVTIGSTSLHAVVGAAKGGAGTSFFRSYRRADYVLHKYYTVPPFQI